MALAPSDVASVEESTAIRLVTAHRCGDRDAFAELVTTHYPSLMATARRRLGNEEDAKDAVQETLLRALLAFDRFGDSGDWRLGAWLHTILLHVCADTPRRQRPTAPLDEWVLETVVDDRDETVSDPVALAAVRRAISELPTSHRQAFELRLVDDLPYDQVAGLLGISEVNARAKVRRARLALQRSLGKNGAVKGAWAAVPLLVASPLRAALRRVFAGAGDSARMAGAQAVASGAASGASSAASGLAGSPVETGLQLVAQVSATPLGQAIVASATSAPGKGSVVLGIVASLATAGGLSAPAIISGTAGQVATPPPHASVVAPAVTAAPSTPAPATPAAGTGSSPAPQGGGSTATSPSGPPPAVQLAAPAWMTLATSAAAYRVLAPSTFEPPSPSSTGGSGSAPAAGSSSSTSTAKVSTGQGTSSSTASASSGTGTSSSTAGTSSSGATPSGASTSPPHTTTTTTGGTSTGTSSTGTSAPATGSAPGGVVALPIGTCTGVTGFPGVTAPPQTPPLSSTALQSILSTGALALSTADGSPAFAGTGMLSTTSGSSSPAHVKVGTCLADGGSILAVDLTGTTGTEVQLVGSLVADPFPTATGAGAYLFRGSVTLVSGTTPVSGSLPWGLPPDFVAEVQVQSAAHTGSLTVVFLEPESQGSLDPVTNTTRPATGAGSGTAPTGNDTAPASP